MPTTNIPWNKIFVVLQDWQQGITEQGIELPSVSSLALETQTNANKAWVVLVSTLISLRTKDEVTLSSSRRLLAEAPTPEMLLTLDTDHIAQLIYPAGFYRTKAKHLQKIADILVHSYKGSVPDNMEALLRLPGVGRKTANLVLSEGYDREALCVDTHVHRICNRAGWVNTKTPDETEQVLRNILPSFYWRRTNWLLVLFGQRICRPQSPFCSRCPLASLCERRGIDRSR